MKGLSLNVQIDGKNPYVVYFFVELELQMHNKQIRNDNVYGKVVQIYND